MSSPVSNWSIVVNGVGMVMLLIGTFATGMLFYHGQTLWGFAALYLTVISTVLSFAFASLLKAMAAIQGREE
jgi:hypothetical protein